MTLVFLALAWFVAITGVAAWDAQWWMPAAWILAAAPALMLMRSARRDRALVVACAGMALAGGWWFARWDDRPPPPLSAYVGNEASVTGTVAGLPAAGETTRSFVLNVDDISDGGTPQATTGRLRFTVDQYRDYRPGDRLRVQGMIEEPPVFDDFDYRAYLARQGIVGTLYFPKVEVLNFANRSDLSWLTAAARLRLQDGIERSIPEPEASLGSGILLGLDGGMPGELEEDYRRSGLAHVVAVSGSNIELVTIVVFFVATPLVGRRWAIIPAAAMIVTYALMAGAEAPVVRAGIMSSILLVGWLMGRHRSALAGLAAAAVLMTVQAPGVAVEPGFQMSVAATAGLIAFAPWLRAALGAAAARSHIGGVTPGLTLDVIALSLSATIAVLPISWVTFERVSLIGPIANVAVAPIFAAAFWLTALTALAEVAWNPAGWAAGLVAYYPLAFMNEVARFSAALPGSSVPTPEGGATVAIAAYAALALVGWPAYRYLPPETPRPGQSPAAPAVRRVALGAAGGMSALAILGATVQPLQRPGQLRIDFLDVGQGDAALITTPGGRQILVDGGPSGIELVRELGAVLPHWDRELDVLVLTHPDSDHIGGLAELARRYAVGEVYETGATGRSAGFDAYKAAYPEREPLLAGERLEIDGVVIEILWPTSAYLRAPGTDELNDTSIVMNVTYGEVEVLLTGDVTAPAQRSLMGSAALRADVLKVPHHGSKTTDPAFLAAVNPDVAIISAGDGNPYGHPAPEIVSSLATAHVYRTDLHGRITIETGGENIVIATER